MTDPKERGKPVISTRQPKKKTADTFANLRPLPQTIEEIIGLAPTHPNPSQPIPTYPRSTQPNPAQPVTPVKDYNKRPNSTERALSAGLFPGTSQKLYNALYLRTRGAVAPARMIKATKRELMIWSGIKSKNTIAINLKILTSIGWLKSTTEPGDHEGAVYEVFVYEELQGKSDPTQPNPTQPNPSQPSPTQKLGGDPTQKLGWVGLGNPPDSERLNEPDKTSFKTNIEKTDDDEAFAAHVALLKQAAKEVTGREPSATEAERWREVAEVLVTELKIAAGRTSVSSVPAFLAEHLRRRLFKKDQKQLVKEAAESSLGPATRKVDASQCPDCFGTGMWYPEGYEKGVSRCQHEKLKTEEEA